MEQQAVFRLHEKALCDEKGYGYDAKTGSCIKTISKKPVTSGGVGGSEVSLRFEGLLLRSAPT